MTKKNQGFKAEQIPLDGVAFRAIRTALAIPQHHVAAMCGVGRKYVRVRDGEAGVYVTPDVMATLTEGFGVSQAVLQGAAPLPVWASIAPIKRRGVRVQTVVEPERERAAAAYAAVVEAKGEGEKNPKAGPGAWLALYGRFGTEMEAAGWPAKRLAKALGTSRENVCGWYTGRASVPQRRMWQIGVLIGQPEAVVRAWCGDVGGRTERTMFDYPATGWGHLLARTGLRSCALASQLGVRKADVLAWARMERKPVDPLVVRKLDLLLARAKRAA